MSERITLPGGIAGLLRRGSPVVGIHTGAVGVVVGVVEGGVSSWTGTRRSPAAYVATREHHTTAAEFSALALDLDDITGRVHAACWLAEQLGVESGLAGQGWEPCGENRWFLRSADPSARGVYFTPDGDSYDDGPSGGRHIVVPALAGFDRRDGSPRGAALALQAVCLHVAGGAS